MMVRADYSVGPVKAGDLFYYAHLGRPSPLKIGARVRAGQVVGYAGDDRLEPPEELSRVVTGCGTSQVSARVLRQ